MEFPIRKPLIQGLRLFSRSGALFTALVCAGGCNDSPTPSEVVPGAEPAEIVLSTSEVLCESLLEDFHIEVTVLDRQGRVMPAVPLEWTLAGEGIVELRGESDFRSLANGITSLNVTIAQDYPSISPGGYEAPKPWATVTVTVQQRPVGLEVGSSEFQVPENGTVYLWSIGQTVNLQAWSVDANGNPIETVDSQLTWASEDSAITTVNTAGAITAVGQGSTLIEAASPPLLGSLLVQVDAVLTLTACATSGGSGEEDCGQATVTFTEGGF